MKLLLLLSAAYTNGGSFIDAGATLEIGTEKHQITEFRADDMSTAGRGEIVENEEDDEDEGVHDELDGLKVADLKDLAAKEDVDLGTATTKPAIIAAIRAHRGNV